MQINRTEHEQRIELSLSGRLDAENARHLEEELSRLVREGWTGVELDLEALDYLSSAGIGVLVKYYSLCKSAGGMLRVTKASAGVQKVLTLSRLDRLLPESSPTAGPTQAPAEIRTKKSLVQGVEIEVETMAAGAVLHFEAQGHFELWRAAQETRPQPNPAEPQGKESTLTLDSSCQLALGIGAFGANQEDCRTRYGEFLAAGGAAVCMPTDGARRPDYQVAVGDLAPTVHAWQSLVGRGGFSHRLAFRASPETPADLNLLIEAGLEAVGADTAGLVLVAQSAGLVGAMLKISPGRGEGEMGESSLADMRKRFSFTSERAFRGQVVLLTGVASRQPAGALREALRPMNATGYPFSGTGGRGSPAADKTLFGHFHAGIFPEQPLPARPTELARLVGGLLAASYPLALLHLLNDERPIVGAGRSLFSRGLVWVGKSSGREGGAS